MRGKSQVHLSTIIMILMMICGSCVYISSMTEDKEEPLIDDVGTEHVSYQLTGTPHSPIYIDGNTNFNDTASVEGWPGDGSEADPYIIDGLDIDLGGTSGKCITILNTNANFTISSCNLTGGSLSGGAGISLRDVYFGNIENNFLDSNYRNMYLVRTHLSTIRNNTCTNGEWAIDLSDSSENTISDNNCTVGTGHGIDVDSNSDSNFIVNNTCSNHGYFGINCEGDHNAIVNNTCTNNDNGGIYCGGNYNTVRNNTISSQNLGVGIQDNGYHTILNNNLCDGSSYGIILDGAFCTADNNTCTNCDYGMSLDGYSDTVSNTTCVGNNNGIFLGTCTLTTVTDCICINGYFGIYIQVDSNTVANNTCSSNTHWGICFFGGNSVDIINNTCNNNGDIGIYAYGVLSDCRISDNTCYNNFNYGIYIESCTSLIIHSNTCDSDGLGGIYLLSSSSNNLTYNVCTENTYGIDVNSNSDSNFISNNTCSYNGRGVRIDSTANMNNMMWNNLIGSSIENCRDNNGGNLIEHNYWSDYSGVDDDGDGFGDTPYILTGNSDPHPLMYQVTQFAWVDSQKIHTSEFTDYYRYDFNISSYAPVTWTLNDTTYFNIDGDGVLSTTYLPSIGVHYLLVIAENIYGQESSLSIEIHIVVDAENPPEWSVIPTDQFLAFDEELDYQVAAMDPSGIQSWHLNNTIDFSIESTFFSEGSTARIKNKSLLEPGVYPLNITVYDSYDNKLTAIFTVTVEPPEVDTIPPTWIIVPTDQILPFEVSLSLQLGAWDASGHVYWSINDTVHFAIDDYGTITNKTLLLSGDYPLNITISDPFGNSVSAVFTLTVEYPELDTTPPIWIIAPSDQTIVEGNAFYLQLGAWDDSGSLYWSLNDTIRFAVDYYGGISNKTYLSAGTYPLNVTVTDSSGNSISDVFTLTISEPEGDTHPPSWTTLSIYQTIDYDTELLILVEAWDESGIAHWWINDTEQFSIDESGIIRNATFLESGTYRIEVRAFDPYDNYCSAIIIVAVLEMDLPITETVTVTVTTTVTVTPTETTGLIPTDQGASMAPIVTLFVGVGVGGAAVFILGIVILKKKLEK